jgi:predicted Ser/Thr protein kinase
VVPESDNDRPEETKSFKVLSPGTAISHYKIIEKIGDGGMGVVYKATDTRLDRTVALKFLPPHLLCDHEARVRFEHEARAASALNHPNIATIHEIDELDGRCFIAMEYLEGGSLKTFLKGKDLPVKEILDLAVQIGEGLAAAHESGVVHRDIKPDFSSSLWNLGSLYLLTGDYSKAEAYYRRPASSADRDNRSRGRGSLARIPIYRGRLKGAMQVLDLGLAADRMEEVEGWNTKAVEQ